MKMSSVAMARRRVAASRLLQRSPQNGGAWPAATASRQPGRGRPRVVVLGGPAAVAVAVLEVQPQVLDGLAGQLGLDAAANLGGEGQGHAHHIGEVRVDRRRFF